MNNKVLERIRTVMAEKKITQRDFSKGIQVSLTTANKLLNSEGDLSLYTIDKIASYFNVNQLWLLTGQGTKYLKTEVEQLAEYEDEGQDEAYALKQVRNKETLNDLQSRNQSLEEELRRLRYALRNSRTFNKNNKDGSSVVFVDSNSALLYPHKFADQNFMLSLPLFSLPLSRFKEENLQAFEITGESMKTRINNGDWAISKKIEDFSTIRDNYVYVVVLEDEVICRRVLNRLKERKRIRLKADNPTVQDTEVTLEQIKEVWEVKSLMTFKLDNPDFETHDWIKKLEDRLFSLEDRMGKIDGEGY